MFVFTKANEWVAKAVKRGESLSPPLVRHRNGRDLVACVVHYPNGDALIGGVSGALARYLIRVGKGGFRATFQHKQ
jgi:hypothetical protein